jgi:hypothetical protein
VELSLQDIKRSLSDFSLRLLFSENSRFGDLKSFLLIFKTMAGLKIKSFRWKAIRP